MTTNGGVVRYPALSGPAAAAAGPLAAYDAATVTTPGPKGGSTTDPSAADIDADADADASGDTDTEAVGGTQNQQQHQHHHVGLPLPPEHPPSAYNYGTWTAADDRTLLAARARGQHWADLQRRHFPAKTANACRKRYERLMERRGAYDYDARRLERIAHEYMGIRKQMWSGLAARVGEKWNVVEEQVCFWPLWTCVYEHLLTHAVHVCRPQDDAIQRAIAHQSLAARGQDVAESAHS